MTKLLIIGFDAMDYNLTKKTINLSDFNFNHHYLKLKVKWSVTGPSWATFYTGLSRHLHQVYNGWGTNKPNSNIFSDIQDHVFWKILQKKDFSVLVDNLPITPEGFPFSSDTKRDMINWFYDSPYKVKDDLRTKWKEKTKEKEIDELIKRLKNDSFKIIGTLDFKNKDLIFLQFSFIDRIGHAINFKDMETVEKTYKLAYELINHLYYLIKPENLMIVSDHGFGMNKKYHMDEEDKEGVIIVDNNFLDYFNDHEKTNYVDQTNLFDKIMDLFNVPYMKTNEKITKKSLVESNDSNEQEIERRLKSLGYI